MECQAKYDFVANAADELSFTEGMVLTVLDNADSDWFHARHDGTTGYIPANYIEMFQHDWFHDSQQRYQTEQKLLACAHKGAFIVSRQNTNDFKISVRVHDRDGGAQVYRFECIQDSSNHYAVWTEKFKSLNDLVDYYATTSISRRDGVFLKFALGKAGDIRDTLKSLSERWWTVKTHALHSQEFTRLVMLLLLIGQRTRTIAVSQQCTQQRIPTITIPTSSPTSAIASTPLTPISPTTIQTTSTTSTTSTQSAQSTQQHHGVFTQPTLPPPPHPLSSLLTTPLSPPRSRSPSPPSPSRALTSPLGDMYISSDVWMLIIKCVQPPRRIAPTYYTAQWDFTAKEDDEMSLKKGDVIAVTKRYDLDWWFGNRNGDTGFFPRVYVK